MYNIDTKWLKTLSSLQLSGSADKCVCHQLTNKRCFQNFVRFGDVG